MYCLCLPALIFPDPPAKFCDSLQNRPLRFIPTSVLERTRFPFAIFSKKIGRIDGGIYPCDLNLQEKKARSAVLFCNRLFQDPDLGGVSFHHFFVDGHIDCLLTFCYDYGGNRISNHIGNGSCFTHKAVHPYE